MVASGRAKKARRNVFNNQVDIDKLPRDQKFYIEKKITRLMNDMEGKTVRYGFDVREFPCQMMKGKIVTAWFHCLSKVNSLSHLEKLQYIILSREILLLEKGIGN